MSVMTEQRATHQVRAQQAHDAWSALPHGGRDAVVLQVQCGRSHHIAAVYDTAAGPVYAAQVHPRSHGSRDRVDEPHGNREPERWFDLLASEDPTTVDDALPAWCDCGHRSLSRAAVLAWLAEGEHRVIVD
jgi:hypothetical protein